MKVKSKEKSVSKITKIKKLGLKKPKLVIKSEKLKKTKVKSASKGIDKKPKKDSAQLHQKQLEGLKDIDPEFYKFLQDNDKELLKFNAFDSEDEDLEGEAEATADHDEESESDIDDKYHKPNEALELKSDEEDFEDEDEDDDGSGMQKITLSLLRQWQLELQQPNVSIDTIRKVVQAFNSALESLTEDSAKQSVFKVDGAAAFNGVVQLCVLHLHPAVMGYLGISDKKNVPLHKTKKWPKVRSCLRNYLLDISRLMEHVSSPNILRVLLKHLHQLGEMTSSFATIGKTLLKRLIVLWSTADETVRVLAFLCILKITRHQQVFMLNHVLKAMYLSYVRNSKFVSPNTLPSINFMRRSLVEMFAFDLNVAYQHVFLYIRQLAIHLRNAVILKKKDSFQSVYNWQYVNSIRLWVDLLGITCNQPQLQPLIYPLVTITIGAIKLIPTAQYFPLRFHCVQALITLAKQTNTFIPVLPFITEVLNSNTFNKKHSVVSMKPMQFTCILRLNKSQMAENGFRDEVVEQVCALLLEYLAHESATLAFPDLVVPTVVNLKKYLKTCKNPNYSRKLKQILDKIVDTAKFIENERRKVNFTLGDTNMIMSWETQIRSQGTPLSIYYTSWMKVHETKKRRQAAQTDDINDYDLPSIVKPSKTRLNGESKVEDGQPVELFPDSESETGGLNLKGIEAEADDTKPQKPKKRKKVKEVPSVVAEIPTKEDEEDAALDTIDIVKDLDLDDW